MAVGGRVSQYRHIFGQPQKLDDGYSDVNVSSTTIDSNMLAANSRYIALPWDAIGGGSFTVVKTNSSGKLGVQAPLFTGHKNPVIDVAFDPFNDSIVTSASEDSSIRLWKVEEENGKVKPSSTPLTILAEHKRKIVRIAYNKLVNGALASVAANSEILLWDIHKTKSSLSIKGPASQFLDLAWSQDGNRVGLPCKDKKLHVYDIRSGNECFACNSHHGLKGSRVVFYNNLNYIATTGYGQNASRQIFLRDERNPEKTLASEDVDYNSGILIPFIDDEVGVMYTFGRGDTQCKYYEFRDDDTPLYALSATGFGESIRAICQAPKYTVDTTICELDRFYMITNSKHLIHLPMIVPRRNADQFQDDIYPECVGPEPSIEFDEWKGGKDATPKKVSLENFKIADHTGGDFKVTQSASELDTLKARVSELEKENAALKEELAQLKQ